VSPADDRLRVVVVDDDVAVAAVHRGYVEQVPGFVVVAVVHRGAPVVDVVRRTGADLVLLDVHLPDMSGVQVLEQLRAQRLPVDVIAVTAAREVETVRGAMAGGVVHYLVKPFPLSTFTDRLQAYALHRRQLDRARDGGRPLDQGEVDRLLQARQRVLRGDRLPKGLSERTLELVATTLRRTGTGDGDVSASELAEECGLARVSARRYLEHLENVGLAEVRPRYGRAGRPENGYRWTG